MKMDKYSRCFASLLLSLIFSVSSLHGGSIIPAVSAESVSTGRENDSSFSAFSGNENEKEDDGMSDSTVTDEATGINYSDSKDEDNKNKDINNEDAEGGSLNYTDDATDAGKTPDSRTENSRSTGYESDSDQSAGTMTDGYVDSDGHKNIRENSAKTEKNRVSDPEQIPEATSDSETDKGGNQDDSTDIIIDKFYAHQEHIYTKEKTKWYAAYDTKRGQAHVTFFIEGKGNRNDLSHVCIVADNGSARTECMAELEKGKDSGERWTCKADFDEEGLWSVTAKVTDKKGHVITKALEMSDSSDHPAFLIDNSCPQIEINYDCKPYKGGGEDGSCIYYGTKQRTVSVNVTDKHADYTDEEQTPKVTWKLPEELQAPKPEISHSVVTLTKFRESYDLDQEGSYTFQVSCITKNGRKPLITESFAGSTGESFEAGIYKSRTVLVDHTPPKLSGLSVKSGDNHRFSTGEKDYLYLNNVSKSRASIRYMICEQHLDPDVPAMIVGQNKRKLMTTVADADAGEDMHQCETAFDISDWHGEDEGTYQLKFTKITDKAGNPCIIEEDAEKSLDCFRVVIDRTRPQMRVVYPEVSGLLYDSERYSGNSTEIFYDEHKKIRFELKEKNYLAGISEKYLKLYLKSRATDEEKEYKDLPVGPIQFETGGKKDILIYDFDNLPEQESHSYFTVYMEDLSGNPVSFMIDEDHYGSFGGSGTDVKSNHGEGSKGKNADSASQAGEKNIYLSPVITLDKTAPLITTSFSDSPSTILDGRHFYNKAQLMTLVVTDENFDCRTFNESLFSVICSGYDYDEKTKELKDKSFTPIWKAGESWDAGTYRNGKKQYVAEILVEDEWNYTISSNASDLAGHAAAPKKDYITLDYTKPYIDVADVENTSKSDVYFLDSHDRWVKFFDYLNYAFFHRGMMRIKITAHDATAGISEIRYRVLHKDGKTTEGIWTFSAQAGKQTQYYTIPADARDQISLIPVDYSGHKGKKADPRGGITETEQYHHDHSRIGIRINTEASNIARGIRYYNSPVSVTVNMWDEHSGIQSGSYTAGRTLSGNFDYGKEAGNTDKKGSPNREIIYNKSFQLDLPAGGSNNSDKADPTVISASFEDHAGYTCKAEERIVIDDREPVIHIDWDDGLRPVNGKYYTADRTASVSIKEANFDESLVKWKIKNMNGVKISRWKHSGENHTVNISFTGEGDDYLMDFTVSDLAGNTASCPVQKAFSIDRTAPVITVSFDNNDVRNGRFFNRTRNAVLKIREHSFSNDKVKLKLSAEKDGHRISLPSEKPWEGSGEWYHTSITFDRDGEYSLSCICTDLAGNVSEKMIVERFVIDTTPPFIRISGVKKHMACNGPVMPEVEFRDSNLDMDKVHILLSGNRKGPVSPDRKKEKLLADGRIVRWADFRRVPDLDDIYNLAVMVKDKAGNVSNPPIITFSVNRFGSNYVFDHDTDQLVNGGNPYVMKPIPIEVTEINVNRLKSSRITVKNENNEVVTLKEGPDYRITKGENKYKWKAYTYHIKASNFANEGQYTITISSVDGAGNTMTNVTRDKDLSFVIDQTRPYGAILGLEEKCYREKEHEISIRADDNYALKEAALYVNGKKIRDYPVEDISKEGGITELLKEKKTVQRVSVKLKDRAGNSSTILPGGNPDGSLITSDRFLQFYYNKPLFYCSILAAVLILFGVAIMLAEKYDKNQKDVDKQRSKNASG